MNQRLKHQYFVYTAINPIIARALDLALFNRKAKSTREQRYPSYNSRLVKEFSVHAQGSSVNSNMIVWCLYISKESL